MVQRFIRFLLIPFIIIAAPANAQRVTIGKIDPDFNKTFVSTGYFNEINWTELSEWTLTEPTKMKFHWRTEFREAEEGEWRLVDMNQVRSRNNTGVVIASGVLPDATRGFFSIDMANYLPAEPPALPAIYHVQVRARKATNIDSSAAVSANDAPKKIGPQPMGFWSAPVVITYEREDSPPTTFATDDYYRKVAIVLDEIELVAPQLEVGREEYFIKGFAIELFLKTVTNGAETMTTFSDPGRAYIYGPYARKLDPPDRAAYGDIDIGGLRIAHERTHFEFDLQTPAQLHSPPRQFLFVMSVLERDGKGQYDMWSQGITRMLDAVRRDGLLELSPDAFDAFLAEEIEDDAVEYIRDGYEAMKAIYETPPVDLGITAFFKAVGYTFNAIVDAQKDDYFGTKIEVLRLETPESNAVSEVHKLPGHFIGEGADKRYVAGEDSMLFYGPNPKTAASTFNGSVRIRYHWEFYDRASSLQR